MVTGVEPKSDSPSGDGRTRAPGGRPSSAEAVAKTEALLDAAREEFYANGFGATSIERVAARCGVTKHTLYRRFSDKEELFAAVIWRELDKFVGTIRITQRHHQRPVESLRAVLRDVLDFTLERATLDLMRILIAEAQRFPDLAREIVIGRNDGLNGKIEALMASARERGELSIKDIPATRDSMLFALLAPVWYPNLMGVVRYETKKERDEVFEMLWGNFLKLYAAP